MVYNSSRVCIEYYLELAQYNLRKHWNPQQGHFCIKLGQGEYETPKATVVALNDTDIIFLNHKNMLGEYVWIPTLNDLIQLYLSKDGVKWESVYEDKALMVLKRSLVMDGILPEIKLLHLLEHDGVIERCKDSKHIASFIKDLADSKKITVEELQKQIMTKGTDELVDEMING